MCLQLSQISNIFSRISSRVVSCIIIILLISIDHPSFHIVALMTCGFFQEIRIGLSRNCIFPLKGQIQLNPVFSSHTLFMIPRSSIYKILLIFHAIIKCICFFLKYKLLRNLNDLRITCKVFQTVCHILHCHRYYRILSTKEIEILELTYSMIVNYMYNIIQMICLLNFDAKLTLTFSFNFNVPFQTFICGQLFNFQNRGRFVEVSVEV